MEILRGYGLGPNIQIILQRFWYDQVVVPKAGEFFGQSLRMERGVNQGDLVSPTIFNIVVDAVVREVRLEVFGPHEAHHGFGWAVVEHNIVFYADDVRISGCKSIWVQTTLTAVVSIFDRVGLQTNLGKTRSMVCTLGLI